MLTIPVIPEVCCNQLDLLRAFWVSDEPCLKKQGHQHLRNDLWGWPPPSHACAQAHHDMHMQNVESHKEKWLQERRQLHLRTQPATLAFRNVESVKRLRINKQERPEESGEMGSEIKFLEFMLNIHQLEVVWPLATHLNWFSVYPAVNWGWL